MERKNAIITGGAGFIGSHLSERLLKEGFDNVYLIDNLVRTEINFFMVMFQLLILALLKTLLISFI